MSEQNWNEHEPKGDTPSRTYDAQTVIICIGITCALRFLGWKLYKATAN